MENTQMLLLKNYATKLSDFELAMSGQVLDEVTEEEQKFINWTLSTYVRRSFVQIVVNATLKGKWIPLSKCAKLLGVSRNALDSLFEDSEPQGWIKCERNKRGWRYIRASDMVVNLHLQYANVLHNKAAEIGLCRASLALLEAKKILS